MILNDSESDSDSEELSPSLSSSTGLEMFIGAADGPETALSDSSSLCSVEARQLGIKAVVAAAIRNNKSGGVLICELI